MDPVFELLREGVLAFDEGDVCVGANARAAELLDDTVARLCGVSVDRILPGAAGAALAEAVSAARGSGTGVCLAASPWVGGRALAVRVHPRAEGVVVLLEDVTAERELSGLSRALTEPVFVIDREGRYCSVAQSGTELLYASAEQLLGRTLHEVFEREVAERLHGVVLAALERQGRVQLEYSLPIRGQVCWFVASVAPLDAERVVWVAHDITERHRAEETLRASKEQLQVFLDTIPEHAWLKDADGRYLLANEPYLAAWNLTRETLVGGTDATRFPAEVAREFVATDRAVAAARQRRTYEHQLDGADGRPRWYEVIKAPVLDAAGEVRGIVGISRDITHRKEAEAALREAEERFRQLAENIPQAFWISSTQDERIVYVSPGFEQIWGQPATGSSADLTHWLETVHPDDRERVLRTYDRGRTRGEGFAHEYRIVRPDGSVRWIQDRGFPVFDETGRPYRFAGVAEDITERRALEEQLRQSQKLEGVGRLAGGVAHDFNNMLLVIQGFASLLEAELPGEGEAAEYLREIQQAAERSVRLTRQLLAYSRRQILRTEVLDVNEVARRLESMLRRMIGEDVGLVAELGSGLEAVEADASQLEQVIINLAVNARDAMPSGGRLCIRTRMLQVDDARRDGCPAAVPAGDYVEIAVQDTGVGMSDDVLAAAFEPFFTTKPVGAGTGLGLSMVYGIVKQSGGHVWAESAPGRGTTIRILLPPARPAGPQPEGEEEEPEPPAPHAGMVLIVEDEPAVRRLLVRLLDVEGFRVLSAATGEEALRLLRREPGPLALALVDVVLPGESGRTVAEQVRALRPEAEIVFMSGYTDDALLRHGVEAAEHRFLQKPIEPAVLLRTVRAVLPAAG